MKSRRFLPVITAALLCTPVTAHAADSIAGRWVTEAKDGVVEISKCGATVCGKLVKYLVTPPGGVNQKDIHNPNAKLRDRKILGINVLYGFKPDGDKWRGTIYDPKSGKSYRSVVERKSPSNLKVEGCIGPFCQGQSWKRAQ